MIYCSAFKYFLHPAAVGRPLFLITHSVRNDFTGLAIAAFIAWKLTVSKAIAITNIPANANIHHDMFALYAKLSSHLCMTNHANGAAITKAITTSFIKSADNN